MQQQVIETRKQLPSRKIMHMCSLSRAQAILSIGTEAATLKEWWDTKRAKKADILEIAPLFSRRQSSFYTTY